MSLFDDDGVETPPTPDPTPSLTRVLNVSQRNFRVSGSLLAPGALGWATDDDLKRATKFGKVLSPVSDDA